MGVILKGGKGRVIGFINADLPVPSDDLFIVLVTQSVRVSNDSGAWVGGGHLYAVPSEESGAVGQDEPTWLLTGDGAYQGLTAMLRMEIADRTFAGVIVEGEPPASPPTE